MLPSHAQSAQATPVVKSCFPRRLVFLLPQLGLQAPCLYHLARVEEQLPLYLEPENEEAGPKMAQGDLVERIQKANQEGYAGQWEQSGAER